MVRAQFEDWLTSLADDDDQARADRLTALFERSDFKRQKDLAEAVHVETRTVQRWLKGGSISKAHYEALAEALGASWRYIVFGEEPELDATQLDRIEELLHEINDRLDFAGFKAPTTEDVADREAQQRDAKRERKPKGRPGSQPKRRAV